ncbi:ferrous iron transport protein B [Anaerobium acetethylicum]|uniref:Ferrous iron transport protein B n=2 Tax=Anaerobium acetethylicum TaxID=1619234 RepID=A0A1D3TVE6_9FIRM|nr:ferrous iron transport protein B [Anaerobium acetethylicum]SCP98091.1 ferrous iron transport protein B [Anaerobium acetethylicum]
MEDYIRVGFVGNPNCGKTTLFNAFTGAKLKVANWPGVTVEKKEGETEYKGTKIKLIDLPGIYSLTSYSIEEKVSRKCIMEDDVDVIVNIVDASSLERNLYLTTQLLELGKPLILALNMMDIVEERGMEIDLHRLPELLGGIPVVPVSARKRTGLDVLMHAVVHHYDEGPTGHLVDYGPEIEEKIEKLRIILKAEYPEIRNSRWHAIKLLEYDDEVTEQYPLNADEIIDRNYEKEIINKKYDFIEEVLEDTLFKKDEKEQSTDRIDSILTHRIFGIPIFLTIMALVFFLTFTVGDMLKGVFEIALAGFSQTVYGFLTGAGAAAWMVSLIVDGIIAGVGGILTFLPNIFILFLALAVLEDSGYMARVAYVMDGIMGKAGLSGKAFLPMVLGFGCTVPAIMATRTLESRKERVKAILITPFMSCSAKLPIYVLFADMFFEQQAMIVAYSLYVAGLLSGILVALAVNKLDRKREQRSLLIELPEYKAPNARTISIYVWEKTKEYLVKAGTTIFIASIIIWFILNFNMDGMTADISTSIGASLGRLLEPVLKPAGLGMWQIGVALISGLSAKEVVVSSFAVLFGIGNVNSGAGMVELATALQSNGFGALNAYSLMIFALFYTPCIATIATIRKETGSFRVTAYMVIFQLVFAWIAAVVVYQGGMLFGF